MLTSKTVLGIACAKWKKNIFCYIKQTPLTATEAKRSDS